MSIDSPKRSAALLSDLLSSGGAKSSSSNVQHVMRRGKQSPTTPQLQPAASVPFFIQNTPTPILNAKHALKAKNSNELGARAQQLVVPNTPCVPPQTVRGGRAIGRKKLLAVNGGYFAAENMPGCGDQGQDMLLFANSREEEEEDDEEIKGLGNKREIVPLKEARLTKAEAEVARVNKKVSSLFKPKASLQSGSEAEPQGCDLSYGE